MRIFLSICKLRYVRNCYTPQKRNFLSSAFECKDVWENRLNTPLFQKVNIENMYYELESQYRRTEKLNSIDVDIFVSAQQDDAYITEMEELIHKLRLTEETVRTLPTTHHAVIRLLLEHNRKDQLIRILNDRINYGIFPDNYCNIYMLNKFLKENDVRSAAKIATIQMLQEDFSNNLVKYLSLYAIHDYLLSGKPWDDAPPEKETDEDEEEVKVRVKYLRNKTFDEHFDLIDGYHLCGKSLIMISSTLPCPLNNSYRIMGLSLFNKWHQLEKELADLVSRQSTKSDSIIYSDSIKFTENIVKQRLDDSEKLKIILESLGQIKSEFSIQDNLLEKSKNLLLEEVKLREDIEIQSQEKLYKDWEILRRTKLEECLLELEKRNRLQEVKRKKEELKQKEELLYFFDNEDEIELVVQEKINLSERRKFKPMKHEDKQFIPKNMLKLIN